MKRVVLVAAVLASGCPQLLDDSFSSVELGSAGVGGSLGDLLDGRDSGAPPPGPDASVGGASGAGASGAGGSGGDDSGASGTGGSAGSAGSAGEDAGAEDGGSNVPDAGGPAPEAGPPPCVASAELCDGVDNDCDEQVDEAATCASGCRGLLISGRSYMFCGGNGVQASTAETRCVAQGMHLVSVESPAENAAIVTAVAPLYATLATLVEDQDSIWMAATDSAVENTWRWGAGGPIFWQGTASGSAQNGAQTNWSSGKPNNSTTAGEDCGVLYLVNGTDGQAGEWNDYPCDNLQAFLCERTP